MRAHTEKTKCKCTNLLLPFAIGGSVCFSCVSVCVLLLKLQHRGDIARMEFSQARTQIEIGAREKKEHRRARKKADGKKNYALPCVE